MVQDRAIVTTAVWQEVICDLSNGATLQNINLGIYEINQNISDQTHPICNLVRHQDLINFLAAGANDP